MQNNKPITTSELAKILNTQNNVILNTAKKYIPNKIIENSVATFFNEEETSIIIKNLDYNNSQAKEPFTAVKGTIKTTLMLQNEIDNSLNLSLTLSKQIETAKSLPKEEKLPLALATFQSLLEDLEHFKGQQNLDLVQDRGHLKEFYNLILNN